MSKTLVEMAAEIVQSQCAARNMTPEEVTTSLESTFNALQALQTSEVSGTAVAGMAGTKPAITPARSILKNKVICLECGQEFKSLTTTHLRGHGLTGKEYRKKYGFKMGQPLCAKSLTESRSKAAKKRGLPPKLQTYLEARKAGKKTGAAKKPAKTVKRRTKKAAKK